LSGTGNALNNILNGNAGDNTLSGGEGNDALNGGLGVDTLIGGQGIDIVTGGAGADVFGFAAADALISAGAVPGFDRITDLAVGSDCIAGLSGSPATSLQILGSVGATLTTASIANLLTASSFSSYGTSAFTFRSASGMRTFVALNDAMAGFQAGTDNVVEITGFTGILADLTFL